MVGRLVCNTTVILEIAVAMMMMMMTMMMTMTMTTTMMSIANNLWLRVLG